MTLLAAPPAWILRGLGEAWRDREDDFRGAIATVVFGSYTALLAVVLGAAARIVSRHRELVADRGSALLTGSPAALAAALLRLSEELGHMPRTDLRVVASLDPLHLLPTRSAEPTGPLRLWATHPRLAVRIAELERLEAGLQRRS